MPVEQRVYGPRLVVAVQSIDGFPIDGPGLVITIVQAPRRVCPIETNRIFRVSHQPFATPLYRRYQFGIFHSNQFSVRSRFRSRSSIFIYRSVRR
jgi:hypothetical protein